VSEPIPRTATSSRPGLVLLVALIAGCGAAPVPPQPGASWTIDAVDRAGEFGTITIERGEVIDLRGRMRQAVPGATRGILVHIGYTPTRASDTGFGAFDWGAAIGDADIGVAEASLRRLALAGDVDWPVEPSLGTLLPGGADPLAGWLVIAVSPAELQGPITLRYQPLLEVLGPNASDNRLVSEIVIHDP
jgi:hypothetical protein